MVREIYERPAHHSQQAWRCPFATGNRHGRTIKINATNTSGFYLVYWWFWSFHFILKTSKNWNIYFRLVREVKSQDQQLFLLLEAERQRITTRWSRNIQALQGPLLEQGNLSSSPVIARGLMWTSMRGTDSRGPSHRKPGLWVVNPLKYAWSYFEICQNVQLLLPTLAFRWNCFKRV